MIFFTITGILVWLLVAICVGGGLFAHTIARIQLRRLASRQPLTDPINQHEQAQPSSNPSRRP